MRPLFVLAACVALLAAAAGCGGSSSESTATSGTSTSAETSSTEGSTTEESTTEESTGGDDTSGEKESSKSSQNEFPVEASSISKADYIAQADVICDESDARQKARYGEWLKENGKPNSKEDELTLVTEIGLPEISQEIDEIKELGSPKADLREVAAVIRLAEVGLSEAEKKPSLILDSSTNPFTLAEQVAAGYGFKSCGFQ